MRPSKSNLVIGLCRCALALVFAVSLNAQNVAASIIGTVIDSTGAAIPGAKIHLVSDATGATRDVQTEVDGTFRIPNLAPGTYQETVTASGFKKNVINNIQVSASETRDMGRLALQVGSQSEEITVTAATTPIQTSSSAVSHSIGAAQLGALPLKGRDVFGAMSLDAGVVDTNNNRNVTQPGALGGISIDGNTTSVNFTVDGVSDMDTGCANCIVDFEPNMDAIQEVKILSSNYSAEYGRNSGGTITVVTKSGTTKFHGSAWAYHRHEQFNANDFFNNASGLSRPLYRYNIDGWSLGGPVPLGWLKNKLFFFASQEYTNQLGTTVNSTVTTPTALERSGNFSQSLDSKGHLIPIIDPTTGSPFPNNTIPTGRINAIGQKMLNFFPLPNYTPAPGSKDVNQANFQQQASEPHPRRNDIVRIDFNPTSKLTSYFRFGHDADNLTALFNGVPFNIKPISHPNPGHGYLWSATYVLSPTLINEATFAENWNTWSWYFLPGSLASVDRSVVGNPPTLLPLPTTPQGVNGYDNVMPTMSFGNAQPNMVSFGGGNFDYYNSNTIWTGIDNVSKVAGSHQLKAGIYLEYNTKLQPAGTNYKGAYDFSNNSTNPLNTGDGFANALLGNYTTFSQSSARTVFDVAYWNVEFYVQDSWRVTRKLNLDLGVRFYHHPPQVDLNRTFAEFVPNQYVDQTKTNPALSKGILYLPGCSVALAPSENCSQSGGQVTAVDPNNGAAGPAAYIGAFVPGANPADGMVVLGKNGVPLQPYSQQSIVAAPRLGFAYDVFGNGKTAIRGGFGEFFNRLDGNQVYNMSGQVPIVLNEQVSDGNMAALASTPGVIAPSGISYWGGSNPWPMVKNGSLGVEQALPDQTSLDVSYVGNFSTHQDLRENINAIPLGADFQPQNISQATGKAQTQNGSALERTIYPGFQDINKMVFYGHSNYNSLQVSVQHRMYDGFQLGIAYTWSKALGVTSYDPLVANNNARNYGPLGQDRQQHLVINYSYQLPSPRNGFLRAVAGDWTFSGLTTFTTGAPFSPVFNSNGLDFTGSGNESARVNEVSNPLQNVPTGLILNPAAFAAPAANNSVDIGNLGTNAFFLPGFNDWDMSISKFIPAGFENGGFSIQIQAFNIFNHPEFTNYGNNIDNSSFAKPTGDAGARVMAFNLRYQF